MITDMQEGLILEENLETAKEFLEVLRITNPRWISKQNNWESTWIFRGQANANWQLIPAAWRNNNLERFKQKYRAKFEKIHLEPLAKELEAIDRLIENGGIEETEGHKQANTRSFQTKCSLELQLQYFAEMQAVKEFTEFADRLGHPVPGANEFIVIHGFRNSGNLPEEDFLIAKLFLLTIYSDPFNVNCSAVALAQHHGVPTRLLDWTENPLMAAFFAAEGFTSGNFIGKDFDFDKDRIAVWAISKEIFSNSENDSVTPSPMQLISRPRHEIGYLLAQKAVFTHDKRANDHFLKMGKWRSVEEAIGNNSQYLKKITLPVSEVGELLRLLWLEGISRAHLMPTYDNVTRALQTKAWWENKSNSLVTLTKREIERYAGYSPFARLFPILDDNRQIYSVIMIDDDPAARPAGVVVMARVVDDKIVIEEDTTLDKPLYEALMHNAGIPREQIILAYAGEKLPDSEAST